ncbi:MAG: response regulator [Saprospiraceae bacterium]|nr:response regulator [Saprospiraceae bacterium]
MKYKYTYWVFILVVILATVSTQLVIHYAIDLQKQDAKVINVAGRQRMLSQNISKTALKINMGNEVATNQARLEKLLADWEEKHYALKNGSQQLQLHGDNSEAIASLFEAIQPSFDIITDNAQKLATANNPEAYNLYVNSILETESQFLALMNTIVNQYEREAEARVTNLQKIEIGIGVFTIFIIVMELLFLIQPLFRRLLNQNQDLGKKNEELLGQRQQLMYQTDLIQEQNDYLRIAKRKAEEAAVAKSRFLSNMSHEIRTPMNAVIGMAHILLEENPRPDQKDHLETIMFSAENLLVIINDILDYSKIEAGKLSIEEHNFNFSDTINGLYKTLAPRALKKGLIFQLDMDEQIPPYLIGDKTRLSQILINLLNNAIKFTEQGKVTFRIQLLQKTEETVYMQFEVIDTGIGIEHDKQEYIFESFSQADDHTTRLFGGTGLGLAITKKLLELQDSDITLKSEPNQGSTFGFKLEFKIGQVPAEQKTDNNILHNGSNKLKNIKKILIVEDNLFNIKVAQRILKIWELDMDIAKDGVEALEMIKKYDYSIVLMDLQMPRMDGYEATAQIRQWDDPKYKSLPIIALSASALEEFRKRAFEVGMNDYITKPFKPKELFKAIERHALEASA